MKVVYKSYFKLSPMYCLDQWLCFHFQLGIAAAPASGEDVEQTKGAVYYKDHTTYPVYQPAHVLK